MKRGGRRDRGGEGEGMEGKGKRERMKDKRRRTKWTPPCLETKRLLVKSL